MPKELLTSTQDGKAHGMSFAYLCERFGMRTSISLAAQPSLLCAGTPGIGKTYFAFALMHWLVTEKVTQTIIYQFARYRLKLADYCSVRIGDSTDFEEELSLSTTWYELVKR